MKFALWFVAMASIAVTWAVMASAFVGVGRLIARRAGATVNRLFALHWLGLTATIALLQVWSLFFAINIVPAIVVLATGGIGLFRGGRSSIGVRVLRLAVGVIRRRPLTVAAGALLVLFLANRAIGPADLWDTRMYHINAMRWANAFPAVPGVVNVQRNVAFNNSGHLLAAMMNVGPWDGRAVHVAAGLFLAPLGLRAVLGLSGSLRKRYRIEDLFFAAAFPAVFALATRPEIASISSDLPAATLTFVGIGIMLRLIRRPDPVAWLSLLCVFACAVCCKLSALGLSGVGFVLVAALPLYCRTAWSFARSIGIAALVAILFAAPYMARGVVLSGYPLFPIGIGGQNVEWKYPAEDLKVLQDWIRAHGRGAAHDEQDSHQNWATEWVREAATTEIDRTIPAILLVIGAIVAVRSGRFGKAGWVWMALIPALVGTMLWFLTSPAVRFGFAFPWALAAALFAVLRSRRSGTIVAWFAVIVCAIGFGRLLLTGKKDVGSMLRKVVVLPGPDKGFHPPPPSPHTTFVSRFGVTIYVPVTGDFCWSAPLPASHMRNPDLRYRVEGKVGSGFITDRSGR